MEDQLYRTWFKLVLEKNRLARYESELMILWVNIHGLKNGKQRDVFMKQERNYSTVFSNSNDVEFDFSLPLL